MTVYTTDITRQRDTYSCHIDAKIMLRELVGKDKTGSYLIPDLLTKLQQNIKDTDKIFKNLHTINLFDSLLVTVQVPSAKKDYDKQYASKVVIHKHQNKHENISDFSQRYPPEEVIGGKKPTVSSYLREKGLKLTHIIEIQFYINQLQHLLGKDFTAEMRNDFIVAAKKELKSNKKISFLTEQQKDQSSIFYNLAQKTLNEYFSKTNNVESTTDLGKDRNPSFKHDT